VSKNKLPDFGSPYEGIGGNIQDAYSFLAAEFHRDQPPVGATADAGRQQGPQEEREVSTILVSTNLVRLSQLEGLGVCCPRYWMLSCKDTIAQSYLMVCIIQVFPDDFHLNTLDARPAAADRLHAQ
jgi:vacuolar protein sorting-associated protein 35